MRRAELELDEIRQLLAPFGDPAVPLIERVRRLLDSRDCLRAIVQALAQSDPLAWVAIGIGNGPGALGAVGRGERFPATLECVLCHGEIPYGHTHACAWWQADQAIKGGA